MFSASQHAVLRGLLPAIVVLALQQSATAQTCSLLNGASLTEGRLYAVYRAQNGSGSEFRAQHLTQYVGNRLPFDDRLRLVYVVDASANSPTFNAAALLAVRLVSSGANGANRTRPGGVYLSRDTITSRRQTRPAWSREQPVDALRYYNFHAPTQLPPTDSLLQRGFHTDYTYRGGEADRSTYRPRDRREKFHFPEMATTQPTEGVSGFVSRWLGFRALADTPHSRFESQIKYVRQAAAPRCAVIYPRLNASDSGALKVTITNLDNPLGLGNPWSSQTWQIVWTPPQASGGRGGQ
jgi:hypothetical protein